MKIDLACEPLILGLCWIWQQREKNINTQNDVIIKSISQTSGKLEWNCEIAQVRYASAEEACKAARLVNFHAFSTMVHRQQRKMSCRIFLWKLLAVQVVHKRGWNRMDETRKKGWRYDDSCRKHASNGDMQQACRGREKKYCSPSQSVVGFISSFHRIQHIQEQHLWEKSVWLWTCSYLGTPY